MEQQAEQTPQESKAIHSPSDWAAKLVEATKIADEDKQSLAPLKEEAELDNDELESDEPTLQEVDDDEDSDELEADADDSEETEPSEESDASSSIVADGTYIIDGEEIDGQTLINGIAATKNFAQEKHRLRTENQEMLNAELEQLSVQRDEYAAGLNFMLGISSQAMKQYSNVNWIELQSSNPAEYQRLKTEQSGLIAHQQQLKGQFDNFLDQVKKNQSEMVRKNAATSVSILLDTFGGDEGWSKRYPELRKVADNYGFKPNEFNEITDHRLMIILDELDKSKAKLSEIEGFAKKKTANPVKDKKRGNSARVNTTSQRKLKDAHAQFLSTRSPKDAARMIMQSQAGPKGR